MHLDHTDGISSMWEELASCFLKVQSLQLSEYEEDEESTMRPIHFSDETCRRTTSRKIPRVFLKGEAWNIWTYRCKWWSKRHFSKAIYKSEIQTGTSPLLLHLLFFMAININKSILALHFGTSEHLPSIL